jgi:hypothetical protein
MSRESVKPEIEPHSVYINQKSLLGRRLGYLRQLDTQFGRINVKMKGRGTTGRPTYQVTITYLYFQVSNTSNCVNLVIAGVGGAQPVAE